MTMALSPDTSATVSMDASTDHHLHAISRVEEGLSTAVSSVVTNTETEKIEKKKQKKERSTVWRRWRRNRSSQKTTHPSHKSFKKPSAVLIGRVVFVGFLCVLAGSLGAAMYLLQRNAEQSLAESQFEAIADRAIALARDITERKMLGAVTIASVYSNIFPRSAWPFVFLNGFDQIVRNIVATFQGRGIALAPIVRPDQVDAFEEFAFKRIPVDGGYSSFGRGIWATDPTNTTNPHYHDTTGETFYGSPKPNILAPILQAVAPDPTSPIFYLLNYHSLESRGSVMDSSLACAKHKPGFRPNENITEKPFCGTITDITPPLLQEEPGAVIILPIFAADDTSEAVGFVGSSIMWGGVWEKAFNSKVSGIDVVLRTSASPDVAYTYRVEKGKAQYKGNTDSHDPAYTKYRQTATLTDVIGYQYLSRDSPEYYMEVYPSADFFAVFSTQNPVAAMAGAVLIIVFTSFLFFLYDALVSKQNRKNQAIIEGRRRFMRFVSHEVRTPLNSVCMGLKLLRDDLSTLFNTSVESHPNESPTPLLSEDIVCSLLTKENGEKKFENLSMSDSQKKQAEDIVNLSTQILGSATNAIDVLNDMLNYDKVETGKLHLEKTVLDIWKLMDHVVMHEFAMPFKAKNIQLVFNTGDDLSALKMKEEELYVIGDAMKITQVFRNILSNALKFTPENGTVTVQPVWVPPVSETVPTIDSLSLPSCENKVSFTRNGYLQVGITDNGVGMNEEQVAKLFTAGVQYNSNNLQKGGGSGLGLFIAKGIIKMHEGGLEAQSDGLGRGTTFSMTIPVHHIPGDHPLLHLQKSTLAKKAVSSGVHTKPGKFVEPKATLKVLVVDDAVTNRKLLSRLLEKQGHQCDQAEDGVVAVAKVKEAIDQGEPYDSILLDSEMPNKDGPSAAKEMHQTIPQFHAFICGITGNVLPEDVAHFKHCGADHVLPKPLDIPALTRLWEESGIKTST